jgi:hypothetical protein
LDDDMNNQLNHHAQAGRNEAVLGEKCFVTTLISA